MKFQIQSLYLLASLKFIQFNDIAQFFEKYLAEAIEGIISN